MGISRPTIDKHIKQGKLEVRKIEGGADVIMLEDTEYNKIKNKDVVTVDNL